MRFGGVHCLKVLLATSVQFPTCPRWQYFVVEYYVRDQRADLGRTNSVDSAEPDVAGKKCRVKIQEFDLLKNGAIASHKVLICQCLSVFYAEFSSATQTLFADHSLIFCHTIVRARRKIPSAKNSECGRVIYADESKFRPGYSHQPD